MLQKPPSSKDASQTVMGHRIEGPRPTPAGLALLALWVAGPVLGLGLLADLLLQWLLGRCLGLWCLL